MIETNVRIFFLNFLCICKIKFYFCITKTALSYGVTVTQQILVLLFQVRILVAQLEEKANSFLLFFCTLRKGDYFHATSLPISGSKSPSAIQPGRTAVEPASKGPRRQAGPPALFGQYAPPEITPTQLFESARAPSGLSCTEQTDTTVHSQQTDIPIDYHPAPTDHKTPDLPVRNPPRTPQSGRPDRF